MQRITTASKRSLAMNYRCCCVLVHAMNYSYCCAIVRSEKTHTLAKYVYASKRSRAMNYRCMQWITAAAASSCMQWITATAAPSCGQKKHTRWRSNMLRSDHVQWITAACNELQLLLRHRAVRRNTHAGHDIPCYLTAAAASSCMQWITATAAPSCGQKKHTRWRSNMLRSDHVQWITAACNELQLLLRHRAVRRNTHAGHDIPCYQLHRS